MTLQDFVNTASGAFKDVYGAIKPPKTVVAPVNSNPTNAPRQSVPQWLWYAGGGLAVLLVILLAKR